MIVQSGRQLIALDSLITRVPLNRSHTPMRPTMPAARAVPIAAPFVPYAGIGPRPRIRITLNTMFISVISTPRRSGVRASPADRSAPPSMKNISMPMLKTNMIRRYGSASSVTSGAALTNDSRAGARK